MLDSAVEKSMSAPSSVSQHSNAEELKTHATRIFPPPSTQSPGSVPLLERGQLYMRKHAWDKAAAAFEKCPATDAVRSDATAIAGVGVGRGR